MDKNCQVSEHDRMIIGGLMKRLLNQIPVRIKGEKHTVQDFIRHGDGVARNVEGHHRRRALSEHRVAVVVAVPVMEGGWEESKEKADTSCCSSLKRIRINKQPNQEHLDLGA